MSCAGQELQVTPAREGALSQVHRGLPASEHESGDKGTGALLGGMAWLKLCGKAALRAHSLGVKHQQAHMVCCPVP